MSQPGSPKTPDQESNAARDEEGNLLRPGIGANRDDTIPATPFVDGASNNDDQSAEEESLPDQVTVNMLGEIQETVQQVLLALVKVQSDNDALRNDV
jgi:hypothetical protein